MYPQNTREKTVHQEALDGLTELLVSATSGRLTPFPRLVRAIAKHDNHNVRSNSEALEGVSKLAQRPGKT
jgi:hypothetical protein